MIPTYLKDKYANRLLSLSGDTLNTILYPEYSYKITLEEQKQYLQKESVAKRCASLKLLRGVGLFGEYYHSNSYIQSYIRDMLNNLTIPFKDWVRQALTAGTYGFSVTEFTIRIKDGYYYLSDLDFLDQSRVSFKGRKGIVTSIRYKDKNTTVDIPYDKCLHIVAGFGDDSDRALFGTGDVFTAIPWIKAKLQLAGNMHIAGTRLATGILVWTTNTGETVEYKTNDSVYENSVEITKEEAAKKQLDELENFSYLVVDEEESVSSLNINDGQNFWERGFDIYDRQIKASFGVPDLLFNEGLGSLSGGATIFNKTMTLLDSSIYPLIESLRHQFLHRIVKLILIENWNEQYLGKFEYNEDTEPSLRSGELQNLYNASTYGFISTEDPVIQNKVRELLKLPKLTPAEILMRQQPAAAETDNPEIENPEIDSDN